jgi:subtilisin family serine protease
LRRWAGLLSERRLLHLNGTSYATPYVAAAAALAIENRGWSQATIASKLEPSSTDLSTVGKDKNTGAGFLNPTKLLAP